MSTDPAAALGSLLQQLGACALDGEPLRVVIEYRGRRVELTAGPKDDDAAGVHFPAAEDAGGWKPLSPLESQIVAALADGKTLSREEIAEACGESPLGRIRGVLSNLVERDVLDTASGAGYFLRSAAVGEESP